MTASTTITIPKDAKPLMPPAEAKELVEKSGARLIDVREPDEFRSERLPGAENLPLSRMKEWLDREAAMARDEPVFVHCQSGVRSAQAVARLRENGAQVIDIEGGLKAWKSAGLPVVRAAGGTTVSIMRQSHIAVGVLNLIGFALAWFVTPWFLAIPIFTSCGLLFHGFSGFCGMGLMLGYMPWNRSASEDTTTSCTKGACS